jgi:hypothetical protein
MEASLDNKSITQRDVDGWLKTAPVDSLIPVATAALDRIASDRSYHDRFTQSLSPQARKLFEGQPVG